jgi:hypothetical protein
MPNSEEVNGMPPNSTQNLNAKLTLTADTEEHPASAVQGFAPSPIQSSGPPVQIVGGSAPYLGGYLLRDV